MKRTDSNRPVNTVWGGPASPTLGVSRCRRHRQRTLNLGLESGAVLDSSLYTSFRYKRSTNCYNSVSNFRFSSTIIFVTMNRRLHTVADPFKPSLEYSLQNVFPPPELSIHAPRPSVHHEPILPPSSPRRDASVESPPSFGLTQDPLAPIQVPVEDSTLTQPVHAHCRYESQCSTMPGLTRSLSPGGRRVRKINV